MANLWANHWVQISQRGGRGGGVPRLPFTEYQHPYYAMVGTEGHSSFTGDSLLAIPILDCEVENHGLVLAKYQGRSRHRGQRTNTNPYHTGISGDTRRQARL